MHDYNLLYENRDLSNNTKKKKQLGVYNKANF